MRHWLRNLPGMDNVFAKANIVPLEELYQERETLSVRIVEAEFDAYKAVLVRWTPDQVSACFGRSVVE